MDNTSHGSLRPLQHFVCDFKIIRKRLCAYAFEHCHVHGVERASADGRCGVSGRRAAVCLVNTSRKLPKKTEDETARPSEISQIGVPRTYSIGRGRRGPCEECERTCAYAAMHLWHVFVPPTRQTKAFGSCDKDMRLGYTPPRLFMKMAAACTA